MFLRLPISELVNEIGKLAVAYYRLASRISTDMCRIFLKYNKSHFKGVYTERFQFVFPQQRSITQNSRAVCQCISAACSLP